VGRARSHPQAQGTGYKLFAIRAQRGRRIISLRKANNQEYVEVKLGD
jgi:uncharacterized DUF497 family protein